MIKNKIWKVKFLLFNTQPKKKTYSITVLNLHLFAQQIILSNSRNANMTIQIDI